MVMPDSAYDILIDGKGYILARQEQLGHGGRKYTVSTLGSSIAQVGAEESRYGNQSPTIELPMVWSSTHLGYGDYRQTRENRYNYSVNADCRFAQQIIPGPLVVTLTPSAGGNVTGFFEQGSSLFCIAGRYCKKIDADLLVDEKDFGEDKAALDCNQFNGLGYVGMGYSEDFWQRAANGDWAQATGLRMGYMAVMKDRIWASVTKSTVAGAADDPTNAASWAPATPYTIGDPGTEITGMVGLNDLLYVGKTDGLHALDSEGIAPALTPELRAYRHINNCRNLRPWHGSLWVPHIRGMYNYQNMGDSGFMVIQANPSANVALETPVRGMVTAIAGDAGWLYASLLTLDGDTYIVAGRETGDGESGLGRLVWHPLVKLTGKTVNALHISGLFTNPRLYMGVGEDVAYIILPRYGDNPLTDSNCRYSTSFSIYYSAHNWGSPTTQKVWKSIEIESERLNVGRYVMVYVRVDGGTSWIPVGRANISPRCTLALDPNGLSGTTLEVRIDGTLAQDSMPLVLRSITARGVERPSVVDVITAVIRCSNELTDRRRKPFTRTGAEIHAALKALAQNASAVTLIDPTGISRRVIVQPDIQEQEIEQEGGLGRELLLTVRMAVFAVSPTSPVTATWAVYGRSRYGGGDAFH